MSESKKLSFGDVKKKVKEHMKTFLEVEEFEITHAKLEKVEKGAFTGTEREVWEVTVEFREEDGDRTAIFKIDAITGEVLEFKKGLYWRL